MTINSIWPDCATDAPRGVSYRRPIDEAKDLLPILEVAERECDGGVQRRGSSYVARCPIPGHPDENPSCKIDPGEGRWFCFVCDQGGDVVDLYAAANGHENLGEAAGFLLLDFGHEVPQRPPAWYARQKRQEKVRDMIDREKVEHLRLLVFRMIWTPWLKRLPESVREESAMSAWKMSRSMALAMYERGRGA